MIVRNFQRLNCTFPFSSETPDSLLGRPGSSDQCVHYQLYGQYDLDIVCSDGECGAHQAVLGQASKMVKEVLIGESLLLDNGDVLNVMNSRKMTRTMMLPDIKKSTVTNLLSVLYTGNVVMNSLKEAGELKALWRLLKVDLIHIKDLQILFETENSNPNFDNCDRDSIDSSGVKVVEITKKRPSRWRRSKVPVSKTRRRSKLHQLCKQKKPNKKKLLKIFEEIFAQVLRSKVPLEKDRSDLTEEGSKVHNEEAQNGNVITVTHADTIPTRATIIQPNDTIITESTLSYEDQNFSYNIDLLSPEHNTNDESQDVTYQSQNHSICIPFPQDDGTQVPLQLPLSYTHRPSIFVPVTFQDQLAVSNGSSTTFSYFSSPSEHISHSSKQPEQKLAHLVYDTDGLALLPNIQNEAYPDILDSIREPIAKDEIEKCEFDKYRNVSLKNTALVLGKAIELNGKDLDIGQDAIRRQGKKKPKFRENNNWVGKRSVDDIFPDERLKKYKKPRKKIAVIDKNFCKKSNLIKDNFASQKRKPLKIGSDISEPFHKQETTEVDDDDEKDDNEKDDKRKRKFNRKFTDFIHDKRSVKHVNGETRCNKKIDVESKVVEQSFEENVYTKHVDNDLDEHKCHENSNNGSVCECIDEAKNDEKCGSELKTKSPRKSGGKPKGSKIKTIVLEESMLDKYEPDKYQMDKKVIRNYLKSQSKLKVINKWTIDPELDVYDKSNDKNLRRENNIRASFVDLPNIMQCYEGILYYPSLGKLNPKKRNPRFTQPQSISVSSAMEAVESVKDAKSLLAIRDDMHGILDDVFKHVVNTKCKL